MKCVTLPHPSERHTTITSTHVSACQGPRYHLSNTALYSWYPIWSLCFQWVILSNARIKGDLGRHQKISLALIAENPKLSGGELVTVSQLHSKIHDLCSSPSGLHCFNRHTRTGWTTLAILMRRAVLELTINVPKPRGRPTIHLHHLRKARFSGIHPDPLQWRIVVGAGSRPVSCSVYKQQRCCSRVESLIPSTK